MSEEDWPEIDLDGPILPNEGLGGLDLRRNIRALKVIRKRRFAEPEPYRLVTPYIAKYHLADGAIVAAVDVRNGKVYQLEAHSGYAGALFGKIRVGMLVREAMAIDSRIYYDEAEALLQVRDVPGVVLDVATYDPPVEEVPGMNISSISVFATEAVDTSAGQRGDW